MEACGHVDTEACRHEVGRLIREELRDSGIPGHTCRIVPRPGGGPWGGGDGDSVVDDS